MEKLRYRHRVSIRICHWLNVQLLITMIWSGVLIYWANPQYGPIPEWAVQNFRLHHRLAEGMGFHFLLMWPLMINGIVYLFFTIISSHWKDIIPAKDEWSKIVPFILGDIHLSKKKVSFRGPYNPAQKLAYTSAFLLGIILIISGFAIFRPVQLGWLTELIGGYEVARFIHFVSMILMCLFIFLHLLQVLRAGWKNLISMITGEIE